MVGATQLEEVFTLARPFGPREMVVAASRGGKRPVLNRAHNRGSTPSVERILSKTAVIRIPMRITCSNM